MKSKANSGAYRHRRRASVYFVVLGAVMIVTIIGLSAMIALRVQRRTAEGTNDIVQARLFAQSAIEWGFFCIKKEPAWRVNRGAGVWAGDQPIGDGTFSLEAAFLADGDGNPDNDPVVLTGTGVSGQARQKIRVTVVPSNGGMIVSAGSFEQIVD